MRTTVVLDDVVLRQARRRAAERGTTLSSVVNDALREAFRPRSAEREGSAAFSMITYGSPRRPVQHEPIDLAAVMEAEDQEALGR